MRRDKRSAEWRDICDVCGKQYRVESLSYSGYESTDGGSLGARLVCSDCLSHLPSMVVVNGREVWQLITHAY